MAKNKPHNARTPISVEKHKKMFLAQLANGYVPGVAAERIDLARGTVYKWKKEDQEFDEAWQQAIEMGIDRIENKVYRSALGARNNLAAQMFILKHKRREVYGDTNSQQTNLIVSVSVTEQMRLMERLGIPAPRLEGDYDATEDDAPAPDS